MLLKKPSKSLLAGLMLGSLSLSSSLVYAEVTSGSIRTENVDKAAYADLAKISLQDAVNAALKSVQGKVTEAELTDENGFLVWEVKVESPDKKITEVYVDAGTGAVLGSEAGD